jgi:predicted protein tyrosine phosphatase
MSPVAACRSGWGPMSNWAGPRLPDYFIAIASRGAARRILMSAPKRRGFAYVVSIGSPGEPALQGLRFIPGRLRLAFEDTRSEATGGPSREDIERIVQFARGIDPTKGRVLIHCRVGVSRSSAAAVIVAAVLLGPGCEAPAVTHVLRVHPRAQPNVRMLELADEVLQTGGALVLALKTQMESGRPARRARRRPGS